MSAPYSGRGAIPDYGLIRCHWTWKLLQLPFLSLGDGVGTEPEPPKQQTGGSSWSLACRGPSKKEHCVSKD